MAESPKPLQLVVKRELALFLVLLFCGLVLLPVLIYVVGQQVFGSYGGSGFGAFFGEVVGKLLSGQFYAWVLVLSPYLTWQIIRLMLLGWRASGSPRSRRSPAADSS